MSYPPEKTHVLMRNAPEVEQIWCPQTKSVATAMFQRPNQVFELPTEPYSARSKWFDLLEESLCDTEAYGLVRNTRIERFRVTGMT